MAEDKRLEIFTTLRKEMAKLVPPLTVTEDLANRYILVSKKEAVVAGKLRPEVYFGGLIIQSSYVGFYHMPLYTHQEAKNHFSARLLKMLKGKSCFHIKELDDELLRDIRVALKKSLELYRKNGWI
ncbi:DUF1801 domain-containing protein [Patescibacteria group bacterium]|nr:DUF1801 domain-containing protein [Patescibacteria group bacterium]